MKVRLVQEDPIGTIAIQSPVSNPSVVQTSIFSRPVFGLSSLPNEIRWLRRHEILFEVKAKPRVLKYLFEKYPGASKMLELHSGNPVPIPPRTPSIPQTSEEVTNTPGLAALFEDQHQQALKALREGTGLRSTYQGDHNPTHSAMRPQRLYDWNKPLPGDDDPPEAPSDDLSSASSAVASTLPENALLAQQALSKINSLAGKFSRMKADTKAKDKDLGETIYNLRLQVHDQGKEITYLKALGGSGTASLFSDGLAPSLRAPVSLSASDKENLANQVMSMINLASYATKADLTDFARSSDLPDLVSTSVLSEYVTSRELRGMNLVDETRLSNSMPAPNDVTPSTKGAPYEFGKRGFGAWRSFQMHGRHAEGYAGQEGRFIRGEHGQMGQNLNGQKYHVCVRYLTYCI